MNIDQSLDAAAAEGRLHALNLTSVERGWQASLQTGRGNSFRVGMGATPSAAIADVFAPAPVYKPAGISVFD